jgi:hypothetical protein
MSPQGGRSRRAGWIAALAGRVRRAGWIAACLLLAAGACERRKLESRGAAPASVGLGRPPPATAEAVPAENGPDASSRKARRYVPDEPPPADLERPPAREGELDATEVGGSIVGPWIVDGLVDVAAAGPIAATERGVAMFDRDNRLQLARLEGELEAGGEPRETRVTPLPDDAGPFALARGPAVRHGRAYWVSRGRLLGQRLASAGAGASVVLAEDARVGTRAAVPVGLPRHVEGLPEVAAYVARPREPDAPPTARLWIEGRGETLELNDDLSSGHSVALAATTKGLHAVFLEARTGMSSVHVRSVTFAKGAEGNAREPSVGDDQVVWVGGPARPTTEVFAFASGEPNVRAFLTMERDIRHFGLVGLDVSLAPGAQFPVMPDWRLYDNGIEPAPVALAEACGRSLVALARPSSPVPRAPQELVLMEIDADPRSRSIVLARSRAFFDVSLVGFGGGALLAYVADHRTWARSIRCRRT